MRVDDAVKHYGSKYRIAQVLDLSIQAVCGWSELVPYEHADFLAGDSGGKLKVKKKLYDEARARLRQKRSDAMKARRA